MTSFASTRSVPAYRDLVPIGAGFNYAIAITFFHLVINRDQINVYGLVPHKLDSVLRKSG